jgi:hypothetical protein
MVYNTDKLPRCSYLGVYGICGQPCYRGICGNHIRRTTILTLCTRCGVYGTASKTGICSTRSTGCLWSSQYTSIKMKAKARQSEASSIAAASNKDAFVAHLLKTWVVGGTEEESADHGS